MKRYLNILFMLLVFGALSGCIGLRDEGPADISVPQVKGFEVKDNGSLIYELSVTLEKSSAQRVVECGFYVGRKSSMSDAERIQCRVMGSGFATDVTMRDYGGDYYVCYFLTNGIKETCSDVRKVTVGEIGGYVTFEKVKMLSYDNESAVVSVSYKAAEGVEESEAGICYGSSRNLTVSDDAVILENGRAEINGLKPGEEYFMRPYLKDGDDVAYGDAAPLSIYSVPIVETSSASEVSSSSASLIGKVADDCGKEVTERGFMWVEGAGEPSDGSSKVKAGSGAGEFTAVLSDLLPNRTYSARAYAENSEGVGYGAVIRFTTGIAPAVLGRVEVSGLTSSSAVLNGTYVHDGGEPASERGFYWGVSAGSLVKEKCAGSGFTISLTGLERNTVYYAMPYSVNSAGVSEGDLIEFTTYAELPVVVSSEASQVGERSALCGGSVTDDGGADVTERGVVWGADPELVSDASRVGCGAGPGDFAATLEGLDPNVTYYFQAYAVNSAGTSYGEVKSFATLKAPVTLSSSVEVYEVTENSAKVRFEIVSSGGCSISEAGVCLIDEAKSERRIAGTVTGNCVYVLLQGLKSGARYSVIAYAVNDVGETRGEEPEAFRTDSAGSSEGFGSNDYEW